MPAAWMLPAAIAGSGVLNYLSGQEQRGAISDAAGSQAEQQANALALQERIYDEGVARQAPWLQAGQNALAQITSGDINLEDDPGYQFRMAEGMKALERAQAGMPGGPLSGRGVKEAQRYAQGLASQEYGNAFNRLSNLAGIGQTAVGQTQNLASQYGTGAGNVMLGQGQAAADASLARGGVQAGMYGNLANTAMQGANLYQQQNALNQMYQQNIPMYSYTGSAYPSAVYQPPGAPGGFTGVGM